MTAQIDRFFKDGEMFSFLESEITKPFEELVIKTIHVDYHGICDFCKQVLKPEEAALSLTYHQYDEIEGPFIAHERCICMFGAQEEKPE